MKRFYSKETNPSDTDTAVIAEEHCSLPASSADPDTTVPDPVHQVMSRKEAGASSMPNSENPTIRPFRSTARPSGRQGRKKP